jgi:hypothetical protein
MDEAASKNKNGNQLTEELDVLTEKSQIPNRN